MKTLNRIEKVENFFANYEKSGCADEYTAGCYGLDDCVFTSIELDPCHKLRAECSVLPNDGREIRIWISYQYIRNLWKKTLEVIFDAPEDLTERYELIKREALGLVHDYSF